MPVEPTLVIDPHYSVVRQTMAPQFTTPIGAAAFQARRGWERPVFQFRLRLQQEAKDYAEYLYGFYIERQGDRWFWFDGKQWGDLDSAVLVGYGNGTQTQFFVPNRHIISDFDSFEGGLWTADVGSGWVLERNRRHARTGFFVAKRTSTGNGAIQRDIGFEARPNWTFSISALFKTAPGTDGQAYVGIAWYDEGGNFLSFTNAAAVMGELSTYTASSGSITAPANAFTGNARLVVENQTSGTWYADDILVIPTSSMIVEQEGVGVTVSLMNSSGLITFAAAPADGAEIRALYRCRYKTAFVVEGQVLLTDEEFYNQTYRYEGITLREVVP